MLSLAQIRWCGVAAIGGGALALIVAPMAAGAYYRLAESEGWGRGAPALVQALGPALEPLLGLLPPEPLYALYGRLYLAVLLLFLVGLLGLRGWEARRTGQPAGRGFKLAFAAVAMNLLGNLSDYWLGVAVLGPVLWGAAFALLTLGGLLVLMIGLAMLGWASLRAGVLPGWSAWALIVGPTLGVPFSLWGVPHIPSGFMVPLGVAWLLLGLALVAAGKTPVGPRAMPSQGRLPP